MIAMYVLLLSTAICDDSLECFVSVAKIQMHTSVQGVCVCMHNTTTIVRLHAILCICMHIPP